MSNCELRIKRVALAKDFQDNRMAIITAGSDNDPPCFTASAAADSDGGVLDLFEDNAGLFK